MLETLAVASDISENGWRRKSDGILCEVGNEKDLAGRDGVVNGSIGLWDYSMITKSAMGKRPKCLQRNRSHNPW